MSETFSEVWGLRCNCWEWTADRKIWEGPGSQRTANCILRNQCYENKTDARYVSGIIDWKQVAKGPMAVAATAGAAAVRLCI